MKRLLIGLLMLAITSVAWGQTCSNTTQQKQHMTYSEWIGNWDNLASACTAVDAPDWEDLTNTADTATAFVSNNTAETVTFDFQSAYAADQFIIQQSTGNPTAGAVLSLVSADTDSPALKIAGATQIVGGAAAAAIVQRFGASVTEGMEIRVIDEVVATGAINNDLTEDIPDGAVIISVQANVETAMTGGGTTDSYAIGTSGNPDLYSPVVGLLTQNIKLDTVIDWTVLSGAEDVQVNGVTAAGAAGDTALTVGTVRVRIVYLALNSLDDA